MNFVNPPLPPFDKRDSDIVRALHDQVRNAVNDLPYAGTEMDVVTVITRPMWEAFLRFVGHPPGTKPTIWLGLNSIRVWGSYTHVVESDEWWSASSAHCPF